MTTIKSIFTALALFAAANTFATPITSITDSNLAGAVLESFNVSPTGSNGNLTFGDVHITGGNVTWSSAYGNSYGMGGGGVLNWSGSNFTMTFNTDISAFGIWNGAQNYVWQYKAYDASGNLLETVNTSGACCGPQFNGIAQAGIRSVVFVANGDVGVFDNLYYTAGQVPEPASIALLGIGLIGFAASRRKKNQA
jgi:hypothetical protein